MLKIALAQINPVVGDLEYNCEKILEAIRKARAQKIELLVFPEMALCGYPPEDLLLIPSFISAIGHTLEQIVRHTEGLAVILGCVRPCTQAGKALYNSAAVMYNGVLLGFQDKVLLPEYDVFYEKRYFHSSENYRLWNIKQIQVAITICEDIWFHADSDKETYVQDPIEHLKALKPDMLINLSASPYTKGRPQERLRVCQKVAQSMQCKVALCNLVGANDALIFDGHSLCIAPDGSLHAQAAGFEEDFLILDPQAGDVRTHTLQCPDCSIKDLFHALVLGVRDYFHKLGFQKACLGLSGGIDSALVAVIAAHALGKENVLALALPSRFSTEASFEDAQLLVERLGIAFKTLSIEPAFIALLESLEPHMDHTPFGLTQENLQARIRGTLLMAFCNQYGYLLLATSNKSEMAMGYSTLYGDMCGALCVLSDITKTDVYALAEWLNLKEPIIPLSIVTKAPSAELRPHQKDTDTLPPYATIDRVLAPYMEQNLSAQTIAQQENLPLELVQELIHRININEFKRRQAPIGLRVTKKAFNTGRRFPIVQRMFTGT